ncbi:MAG: HAMP domain-containing histidine kinase [Methanobacteriaceae archaeon]|nr:HAMP domain-containing histidine kinase [Methanobacteriaceae archaeon]
MDIDDVDGIAFTCNLEGFITSFIYDGLGLNFIKKGAKFVDIVDDGSASKALDFIQKIRKEKAAFDWELNLTLDKNLQTLYFSGFLVEKNILITAARTRDDLLVFLDEMYRINNEQTTALRKVMKECSYHIKEQEAMDRALLDEIGRLNNELTNAQRQLTKKNIQLAKLNQEKNQFLGMAAHDLRNPLSVIMMYSEFIIDEAGDDLSEEHQEFLQVIYSSSEFMLNLINELLDVSKIESGKLELELEPTNIIEFIKDNLSMNQVLAHKKDIIIDFSHDEGINDMVMIDRARISQVLNNLVSNAIKFSSNGQKVKVNLSESEGELRVTVTDHGQGIPEDELHKLFKPFSKTRVKGTAGEKSTGLGLSISKRIITEHGGEIGVESKYGKGSKFFFTLKTLKQGV